MRCLCASCERSGATASRSLAAPQRRHRMWPDGRRRSSPHHEGAPMTQRPDDLTQPISTEATSEQRGRRRPPTSSPSTLQHPPRMPWLPPVPRMPPPRMPRARPGRAPPTRATARHPPTRFRHPWLRLRPWARWRPWRRRRPRSRPGARGSAGAGAWPSRRSSWGWAWAPWVALPPRGRSRTTTPGAPSPTAPAGSTVTATVTSATAVGAAARPPAASCPAVTSASRASGGTTGQLPGGGSTGGSTGGTGSDANGTSQAT